MAKDMDPGKFTEQAAAQSKENLDKMGAAAQDATNLVKDTYSASIKRRTTTPSSLSLPASTPKPLSPMHSNWHA